MRLLVALLALSLPGCTLGQAKVAAYAGVAADLATTQRALDIGLREANPLLDVTGEPMLTSAAVSAAVFGAAAWAEKHDPDGALWFYRYVAIVRGGMAVWNASRIIKHHNHRPPEKLPPVSAGIAVRF